MTGAAPSRTSSRERSRHAAAARWAWLLAASLAACLPGIDEWNGEDEREVGTASVSPVPRGGDPWETDSLAWQFGGNLACGTTPPGTPTQPGQAPVENPMPAVVEIWDGLVDPCTDELEEGTRVLRIQVSDVSAGTYPVAQGCVGPRTARVLWGEVRGGALFFIEGQEGSVTLLGLDDDDVLEGAFSVRFADTGFTSGGFRAAVACLAVDRFLPVENESSPQTP